jgi:hypothetical protein
MNRDVHTGMMDWYCPRCDEKNAGIKLGLGLKHVDCLLWVEIKCKKCGKPYRWSAREHLGVGARG